VIGAARPRLLSPLDASLGAFPPSTLPGDQINPGDAPDVPTVAPATFKPTPVAPVQQPVTRAPSAPADVAPSIPGGGVLAIAELPDGAGGTVPVPPTPLAPPSVVPPPQPPVDVQPWMPSPEPPVSLRPWMPALPAAPVPVSAADPYLPETPAPPSALPQPIDDHQIGMTAGQGISEAGPVAVPPTAFAPADATPLIPQLPVAPDPVVTPPASNYPWMPVDAPAVQGPPVDQYGVELPPATTTGADATAGQGINEASGGATLPWQAPAAVTPPVLATPTPPPASAPAGIAANPAPATLPIDATVNAAPQAERGALSGGGGTGVALPDFTAENNLISKTVLPQTSDRMQSINAATDALVNEQLGAAPILPTTSARETAQRAAGDAGLTAQDAAPDIAPGNDPRLMKFQNMSDEALNKILHGPNRLDIAKQMWDAFTTQTEGDYRHSLTDATDEGAAHGRLQSGILTNRYGDIETSRERDLNATKGRLLAEALQGTIGDQQAAYDAVSGAERNAYGEGASDRAELRTERDKRLQLIKEHYGQASDEYQRALEDANQQRTERTNRENLIGTVEGVGATQDARDRADRGEVRTERGYEDTMAQRAIANKILEYQAQSGADQQAFDNALKLFGVGNANNPTGAYETAAGQAASEAGGQSQSVADLLKLIAQLRAGQGTPPAAGG
jgi:hypothetical protein